jgi:hypothetical protein
MSKQKRHWSSAAIVAISCSVLVAAAPGLARDRSEMKAEMAEAVEAAFTDADVDGSATLDTAEFAQFHTILEQRRAEARFDRLDADSDGAVSLQEIKDGRRMGRHGKRDCRGGF